ncbi:MAG: hypothetical protein HY587_00205 [Candidatus Omnitrophica bacterium]|nr:hypothetical protein [Candidatus Omnitrophota bacterium]
MRRLTTVKPPRSGVVYDFEKETLHAPPRLFDTQLESVVTPAQFLNVRNQIQALESELALPAAGFGAEKPDEAVPELPEQVKAWTDLIRGAQEKIIEAKLVEQQLTPLTGTDGETMPWDAETVLSFKGEQEEALGGAAEDLQEAFSGAVLNQLTGALDTYFTQLESIARNFRTGRESFVQINRDVVPIEMLVQQAVNEFDYLESALKDSALGRLTWVGVIRSWRPEASKALESIKVRWFEFYKSLADYNLQRFSRALRFPWDNPDFQRMIEQIRAEGYPKDAERQKEVETFLDLIQIDKERFLDLVRLAGVGLDAGASFDHQIFLRSLLEDSYGFIQKADEYLTLAQKIVLDVRNVEIERVEEGGDRELADAEALSILPHKYQGFYTDLAELYGIWADDREEWLADKDADRQAQAARDRSDEVLNISRYRADDIYPLEVTLDMADKAHARGRVGLALRHLQEFLKLPLAARLVKNHDLAAMYRNFLGNLVAARVLVIHGDRSHNKLGAALDQAVRDHLDTDKLSKDEVERLLDIIGAKQNEGVDKARQRRLNLLGVEKETFLNILDQVLREVSEEYGRETSLGISSRRFIERLQELERLGEQLKKGELVKRGIKNVFDAFDLLFPDKPILEGDWTPRDEGVTELLTIHYSGILDWDGEGASGIESGTKKASKALSHIINRGLLYQRNKYQLREHVVTMRRIKERIHSDGAIRSLNMSEKEMEFLERILDRALLPAPDAWFEQAKALADEVRTVKEEWSVFEDKDFEDVRKIVAEKLLPGLRLLLNEENRIHVERVIFSAFADLEAGGIKTAEEQALLAGARRHVDLVLGILHAVTGFPKPAVGFEDPKLARPDPDVGKLLQPMSVLSLSQVGSGQEKDELLRKSLAWLENIYVQAFQYYRNRAHRELGMFESNREDEEYFQEARITLDIASSRLETAIDISKIGRQTEESLYARQASAGEAKKGLPYVKKFDYSTLSIELAREYVYQSRLLGSRTDERSEELRTGMAERALEVVQKAAPLEEVGPLEAKLRAVDKAFIPFGQRNIAIQVLDDVLVEASIDRDLEVVRKAMTRFLILEKMGPRASLMASEIDNTINEILDLREKWKKKQEHVRADLVRRTEARIPRFLERADRDREIKAIVEKMIEWGRYVVDLSGRLEYETRKLEARELFPAPGFFGELIRDRRRESILLYALAHWTEVLVKGEMNHAATDRQLAFIIPRGLFYEDREEHTTIVSPDELRKMAQAEPRHVQELGDDVTFYDQLMELGGLYESAGFGFRTSGEFRIAEELKAVYDSSAFAGQSVDYGKSSARFEADFVRLRELSERLSQTPKAIFTAFDSLPDDFSVIQKFLDQNVKWYAAFKGSAEDAASAFKNRFALSALPENIRFVAYSDTREINSSFASLLRQAVEVDRVGYENMLAFFGPQLRPVLKKFSSLAVRLYDAPDAIQEIKWETILALMNAGAEHPAVKAFLAREDGFWRIVSIDELAERLRASTEIAVAA